MKPKKINGKFFNKSIVSIDQFQPRDIKILFKTASMMEEIIEEKKSSRMLKGYSIAELFYQPSTRTYSSFLAAAKWLGAITIPIHGMNTYSSAVKGESIQDTVRTIHQTTAADLIILRHPEDDSSQIAAKASYVPIINAGSGKKEHPTQALLDLYTIKKELGRMKNLKVLFLGDLKYSRTIKSLGKLLSLVDENLQIYLVSPKFWRMSRNSIRQWLTSVKTKGFIREWRATGIKVYETEDLLRFIPQVDVIYANRIQKEWFEKKGKIDLYEKLKDSYNITLETLKKAKKKMIILDPLPRIDEIAYEVDEDPRAVYFQQMRNGLYTRMALLKLILLGK